MRDKEGGEMGGPIEESSSTNFEEEASVTVVKPIARTSMKGHQ